MKRIYCGLIAMDELRDIEEIKKLKARYFRLMDTKCWDEWQGLFAEDAEGWLSPDPNEVWKGPEEIVAKVSGALVNAITAHHGHMPEIELTGPTTATGLWAMFDLVMMPELTLKGFGHYHEEYVKESDGWKIKSSRLTRLHVDIVPTQ